MKISKISICGHFGLGFEFLDGQTVKTKTIYNELNKRFGAENVECIDTHGGLKKIPMLLINLFNVFESCQNIIMLPAENGLRMFAPLFVMYNVIFRRRILYVVIGGWLPEFIKSRHWLIWFLKKFDYIFVETHQMKNKLQEQGLNNVITMPNFKNIEIISLEKMIYNTETPYRLCTFSRVMKEKGIEDAVKVVEEINKEQGKIIFTLDIYGQIDKTQTVWFDDLQRNFPNYIKYGGLVPFDKSVEVLKSYYALLFPTYYDGEGFAGTLLDALASGVPVVVSDWRYNSEIVTDKKTGLIFKTKDVDALKKCLCVIAQNPSWWNGLKENCIDEAKKYTPYEAVKVLVEKLNE